MILNRILFSTSLMLCATLSNICNVFYLIPLGVYPLGFALYFYQTISIYDYYDDYYIVVSTYF